MKPILYGPEGQPLRFEDNLGQTYAPVNAEKFAAWDGSPLKIIMPKGAEAYAPHFVENPKPREVVAVEAQLSEEMLARARKLKRLGGGPLYKAQKAAEAREAAETAESIRVMLDGIRTRPVG